MKKNSIILVADDQPKTSDLSEASFVPSAEEALEYAASITSTVHVPLIVLDHDLLNIDTDIYFVNKSTMVQCNIRDVTEKRRAKEEKKLLEYQIQQAEKMEAIGTLAGGIAHDFNNILSAIIGHTELLLYKIEEKSPFRRSLDQIYFASMRAKALVKQILAFSRQNNSELRLMNIEHIAREVLNLIRSSIPTTIEIRQNISP
nr:hypothetical protein [Desulfobulbaceae bacterium]